MSAADNTLSIQPFRLMVDDAELEDLRVRLGRVRWPTRETVDDDSQGLQLERMRALVEYWRRDYDWRSCEALLNGWGQFKALIDGLQIHFLHVRSPQEEALPLLITHGWPGSVLEFRKVIGPLSNPLAHGGEARDAFHLVIPSLPGYGFSDAPTTAGWGAARIATAWHSLMAALGYERFVAQGGDWGAAVTVAMGVLNRPSLAGIHLNMPLMYPDGRLENATPQERAALDKRARFSREGSAYSSVQRTRPQTLGYALADSPVGQAAWIYEKLCEWSDSGGNAEVVFSRDEMLDNIMLYWLPNHAASSARLYWESFPAAFQRQKVEKPTGISVFPKDVLGATQEWAQSTYSNLIHYREVERGGHFAAWEQPALFVREVRECFRPLR